MTGQRITPTAQHTARHWLTITRQRLNAARLRTENPGITAHQNLTKTLNTVRAVR